MIDSTQLCVLCSERPATTADHVPPKGIFPKPRPSDLITVPACERCNGQASNCDEAFRLYLALHVGGLEDEQATEYFHDALRTYRHNQRLQREILESAKPLNFSTPGGIIYGQGMRVLWNSTAHDAIIERMVRGLYFHHFGEPLAPDVPVSPKWFHRPGPDIAEAFVGCRRNAIADGRFRYCFGRAEDRPEASVWFFEFYQRHWAGAHTGLPGTAPGK